MKHTLVVLLSLLVCAVAGTAEKPPALEICSAQVHLGMTKAEVEASAGGSTLIKSVDDYWIITTGDPAKGGPHGSIQFTAGRVTYADREWLVEGSDAVEAILGATNSLSQSDAKVCVISHDTVSSPGSPFERAIFECGTKRLLILRGKMEGQTIEEISESIGTIKK
jgi:hypothetical protein